MRARGLNPHHSITFPGMANHTVMRTETLQTIPHLCTSSEQLAVSVRLKGHLGFPWEDYQHAVIDVSLCMVAVCALGTDVIVCLEKGQHDSKSTRWPFNLLAKHSY